MIGVGYKTKEYLEFDIGYRYVDYGKIGNIYVDDEETKKAKANIISFGIKSAF